MLITPAAPAFICAYSVSGKRPVVNGKVRIITINTHGYATKPPPSRVGLWGYGVAHEGVGYAFGRAGENIDNWLKNIDSNTTVGAPDQIRTGDLSLSGRALFPSELRGQYVGADGLAFASEPSASPFTHQLYPTRPLVAQYVVVEFLIVGEINMQDAHAERLA